MREIAILILFSVLIIMWLIDYTRREELLEKIEKVERNTDIILNYIIDDEMSKRVKRFYKEQEKKEMERRKNGKQD